ncbi:MAG TPA: hypothetical protein VNC61_02485 [Acidimicrobiales bacterium]|nr:hypothetical protein [Acidimicrobiales bacterium]
MPGPRTAPAAPRVGLDTAPVALAVFEPGASGPRRFLARLGTSRTVVLGLHGRPLKLKGLVSVSLGSVAGMMLAQPFDMVTFVAPLYGLVVGGVGAGAGWVAVSRRRAVTIDVEQWRPQLDAIGRILHNADRIGQPFVSPVALRTALHSALWHAIGAADHAGGADVLAAFDEQLTALDQATEATLVELESPSIAARKADVSDRLAAAVRDLGPAPSPGSLAPQRFDAQGPDAARGSDAAQDQTPPVDAGNGASSPDRSELTR